MKANRNSFAKRPWTSVLVQGPIFRSAKAAAYFGVAVSTYYELIAAGAVPTFIKLSDHCRASGVPKVWLDAAIAARAARAEEAQ